MDKYYNLALFLAFQTPLICLIICSYAFFALRKNGLTRKELICLRLMAISCIGEMVHEVLAGFLYYDVLDYSIRSNIFLYTIAFFFMALAAASFTEFCISRLKKPSGVMCVIIRLLYAVIALILVARIALRDRGYFTFISPDGSIGFGKFDDSQTWCCIVIIVLNTLLILASYFDRNEYVQREKYGKLLAASLGILFVFFIYLFTYIPFIISIGYMLVLLFTVVSNQSLMIYTDELTQLNNRRCMLKNVDFYDSENKPWSFIMADINNFKQVNDKYGHNQGDKALTIFSDLLNTVAINNGATAYRYGGDEFAVIVPSDDERVVSTICDEFDKTLMLYNEGNKLPYMLSASTGYAICGEDGLYEIPDIIESADKKMYENKRLQKEMIS